MADSKAIAQAIRDGRTSLGMIGSTRIKAVSSTMSAIRSPPVIMVGSHILWTACGRMTWTRSGADCRVSMPMWPTAWRPITASSSTRIGQIGFSAMMHGYLAFDADGELLVPFRTWQNTNTSEAHEKLSELFQYNIPERWSIAHLYQAVLDNEPHIGSVRYFTTLSGYVHWKLTGRKVLGIGDASGMFPIDPNTKTYEQGFIEQFDALPEVAAQPWKLNDLLPEPLVAGTPGRRTHAGRRGAARPVWRTSAGNDARSSGR